MLKLKKVAITGIIGSGKTTVSAIFKKLGAFVVNADKISHSFLDLKSPTGKKIIKLLGEDTIVKGRLSRRKIANKVFGNLEKLKALEQLIHPKIQKEIVSLYKIAKTKKCPLFVVEMPLLFETKSEGFYDFVIVVTADETLCKKRYKKQDFEKRMKRHFSQREKTKRADCTIENSGSLTNLKITVKKLFNQLRRKP